MKHLSLLFALFTLLGMNAQAQNDVIQDATKNQVQLKLTDGSSKFYNTAKVQELTFDNGVITAGQDQYNNNVASIAFAKAITAKVNITEAKGWLESAYVKFDLYDNIQKYNVYVKGGQYAEYTVIDNELVRNYGTYGRADVVGLQAGTNYQLKVVPVNGDNAELTQFASETEVLEVKNYSREGFAFKDGYEPGAYKADGTLKDGAKVLYITKNTAKTVKTKVKTGSKDTDVKEITGFQAILDAYQKGYDTTPIAFRLIGLIEKDDLDGISSSEEGIQIKGKNKDSEKEKLKEENAELKDKLLRQMAEFENFRKRNDKEKDAMFEAGAKSVIEKILPVVDNFERAISLDDNNLNEDVDDANVDSIFDNNNYDADPENNEKSSNDDTNIEENPLFSNELSGSTLDDVIANNDVSDKGNDEFWYSNEDAPIDLNSLPDLTNNDVENNNDDRQVELPDLEFPDLSMPDLNEEEDK